jgi:hypothetical protein
MTPNEKKQADLVAAEEKAEAKRRKLNEKEEKLLRDYNSYVSDSTALGQPPDSFDLYKSYK